MLVVCNILMVLGNTMMGSGNIMTRFRQHNDGFGQRDDDDGNKMMIMDWYVPSFDFRVAQIVAPA